ncbi:hypothetical protein NQ318_009858 [Aromia moschata]|uniref:Lipase domain-containing protein n=1 Tax=Aromia moschata TaxID=1265417 RepID=A0AAV8XH78_9CUCU|nr:hypothetical protein NQ318_009858 [Aromia moschata]
MALRKLSEVFNGSELGLDPARPLIDRYANRNFKLTRDDAHQVQIIHTNAGFLGDVNQIGHIDFCVNGGRLQPNCNGNRLHFNRGEKKDKKGIEDLEK